MNLTTDRCQVPPGTAFSDSYSGTVPSCEPYDVIKHTRHQRFSDRVLSSILVDGLLRHIVGEHDLGGCSMTERRQAPSLADHDGHGSSSTASARFFLHRVVKHRCHWCNITLCRRARFFAAYDDSDVCASTRHGWKPNAKSVSERMWQMSHYVRPKPGNVSYVLVSRDSVIQ